MAKFGEWIEITKDPASLPPEDKHVLLKREKDGSMYVGYWVFRYNYGTKRVVWYQPTARTSRQAGMKPSHWMELPE